MSYIDAAVALGNTINEMDKYTPRKIIKTMRLRKGKRCTRLLKNLEAFEPVAESYHAAIQKLMTSASLRN